MRPAFLIVLLLIIAGSAGAQHYNGILGTIEIYGQHHLSREEVLKMIDIKEGDSLYSGEGKRIEYKLKSLPRIAQTHVAVVCCNMQNGTWTMYIGLDEKKTAAIYKAIPAGSFTLPADGKKIYDEFDKMVMEAVTKGEATENDSAGYAWLNYAPAKPVQERMLQYARQYGPELRKVLLQSNDAKERAAAAWIIAYGNNKPDIANVLIYAITDPDDDVRNNAARALGILASYANEHPDAGIHIPAEPFIDMINSVTWTDRNKGTLVLLGLTAKRPPYLLQLLKGKALLSLIQMARWKDPGHSLMAYMLLARLASMPENEILPTFYSDKKDASIDMMIALINAKKD